MLCFIMNVNPLVTIAKAVVDSDIINYLGVLKDNIIYLANQDNNVYAVSIPEGSITGSYTEETDADYSSIIEAITDNGDKIENVESAIADLESILEDIYETMDTESIDIDDVIDAINKVDGSIDEESQKILDKFSATELAIIEAIASQTSTIMGSENTSLTTIKGVLDNVKNSLGYTGTIVEGTGELDNLATDMDKLISTVLGTSHAYRVAHLYSLNNSFSNSLWRPYSSDVPYIEDFATVSGKFAAVYTGYWNTYVSTVNNPGNSTTQRALEILGYDAIVRYQGVVPQVSISSGKFTDKDGDGKWELSSDFAQIEDTPTGLSGINQIYYSNKDYGADTSVLSLIQEFIPENKITYLDAVTLLYKALGQTQYTYQAYMSSDPEITPETSPTSQGLSNITEFDGYNYYVFLNRDNVVTSENKSGDTKTAVVNYIYWNKAVNDGFISYDSSASLEELRDTPITASEFYMLAASMMQAYGEPEINQNEIKALLQVYGSDYPIQLGIDIADAWAYLKVRGCLEVDLGYSDYISRDELLDICMRIADEDSRTDYKVIDIVLDLQDVMKEDGYYPVYDMEISNGQFTSSIVRDYSLMSYYNYLLEITTDTQFGAGGIFVVMSEPTTNESKIIEGSAVSNRTVEIDGREFYVVQVPKSYKGNIYLTRADYSSGSDGVIASGGTIEYIEISSKDLGGGIYTKYTIQDKIATTLVDSSGTAWYPFDVQSANSDLAPYCDYVRAGEEKPVGTAVASNATILESFSSTLAMWFTPMTVYAEEIEETSKGVTVTYTFDEGYKEINSLSELGIEEWSDIDKSLLMYRDEHGVMKSAPFYIADNTQTLLLNRLCNIYTETPFRSYVTNLLSDSTVKSHYGNITKWSDILSVFTNGALTSYGKSGSPYVKTSEYESISDYRQYEMLTFDSSKRVTGYDRDTDIVYDADTFWIRYLFGVNSPNTVTNFDELSDVAEFSYYKSINTALNPFVPPKYSTTHIIEDSYYINILETNPEVGKELKIVKLTEAEKNNISSFNNILKSERATKLLNILDEEVYKWYTKCTHVYSPSLGTYNINTSSPKIILDSLASIAKDKLSSSDTSIGDSSDIGGAGITTNVWSTVIQNRDEQMLVSWNDLKDAGAVETTETDGQPTLTKDGNYYFYTKHGQVKVNDTMDTIQIGTTVYDLSDPSKEGGVSLVYIDNEQDNEIYFDYRCIMGQLKNSIVRSDTKTEQLVNAIGAGDYVVYEIGSSGSSNNLFTSAELNCYNYPNMTGSTYTGEYILKITGADGQNITDDLKYWNGVTDSYRLALSSYMPTANWICVIKDDGIETKASLFVYYLRHAFDKDYGPGFVNDYGGTAEYASCPVAYDEMYKNIETEIDDIIANNPKIDIAKVLEDTYGVAVEDLNKDKWFLTMTYSAVANLYNMTGSYYISSDWVVREFDISTHSVSNVKSWVTESTGDGGYREKTMTSNDPGAVYWVQNIGFVYNMPSSNDFNLSDYYNGVYPLPIAMETSTKMVNYNLNYYGTSIVKEGSSFVDGLKIPIGYTLSDKGYSHYSDLNNIFSDGTIKYDINNLPVDGDKNVGDSSLILPFKLDTETASEDGLVFAPTAVYYTFGANMLEKTNVQNMTQYMTQANYIYLGTTRITMESSSVNSSDGLFTFISDKYNPVSLPAKTEAHRVHRNSSADTLIIDSPNINYKSSSDVSIVDIDDIATTPLEDWLKDVGANDLLTAIDEGASWIIIVSFNILPIIGIILMTVLIGLSFMGDTKIVRVIIDKTIDPVRILTFGNRNIETWNWRTVLFPCTLLYIAFALVLNGNLIRLIQWAAEWYGTIMRWFEHM